VSDDYAGLLGGQSSRPFLHDEDLDVQEDVPDGASGGLGGGEGVLFAPVGTPSNYPFASRLRTRWYDAGWPTVSKRWRRPEVIARDRDRNYSLYLTSFHDFQGGFPRRTRETFLERNSSGNLWGNFDWGGGSIWGRGVRASRMGKMASFGAARSIQFEIEGDPGRPWGLDGLVLKFVSRRFR